MRAAGVGSAAASLDHGLETLQAAHEAGGGQVVLLAVVVGDAGGVEADLGGDVGQGHAAHALTVQDRGGGGQDRLLLAGVARCRRPRDPTVIHDAMAARASGLIRSNLGARSRRVLDCLVHI
jgi:hypothetical protein